MPEYSYEISIGDPRVRVYEDDVWIGWWDDRARKVVPLVPEDDVNRMLSDALKRRPQK